MTETHQNHAIVTLIYIERAIVYLDSIGKKDPAVTSALLAMRSARETMNTALGLSGEADHS